jgi:hypothetical protein
MNDTMYEGTEPAVFYPDEVRDPGTEGAWEDAEPVVREFSAGRLLDGEPGSPVLGLAVSRTAEDDLAGLSGDELLGAIAAAERVAGHYAWAATRLAAEYARRSLEWDPKLGEEVIGEFGEADYAQEVLLSGTAAKGNLDRALVLDKMPRCAGLGYRGELSPYKQRIIAEETSQLDPALLGEADQLIAAGAAGRTPGSLRSFCRKIVFTLDPRQAEERREKAARGRRVEFAAEQSGNALMAARELSIAVAAAIKQALTGWAKIMRAAGIGGSLDNLRADAATALLLGRHPVTGLAAFAGTPAPGEPAGDAGSFNPWEYRDHEPHRETDPAPAAKAGAAPVVSFHLILSEGTLDPKSDAPAFIPGWGWITGAQARDLAEAGSANPASRWCATEVNAAGEAVWHGCARGPRQWTPPASGGTGGDRSRDGPGGTGPPRTTVAEFAVGLDLQMEALGRHPGDDGHKEARHDPSRGLRHLIIARNATCASPGCDASAFTADMEHRIPYEDGGETSEHNLDPGCRHCHRLKQRKDWRVEKTGPCETRWTGPSGRTRSVRPTRYL